MVLVLAGSYWSPSLPKILKSWWTLERPGSGHTCRSILIQFELQSMLWLNFPPYASWALASEWEAHEQHSVTSWSPELERQIAAYACNVLRWYAPKNWSLPTTLPRDTHWLEHDTYWKTIWLQSVAQQFARHLLLGYGMHGRGIVGHALDIVLEWVTRNLYILISIATRCYFFW